MTSSYSSNPSYRAYQGPILLPERLYRSPTTLRHVSSSPNLRPTYTNDVVKKPTWTEVPKRKECLCSPATHPGAFRCSMHRNGCISNVGSYIVKKDENKTMSLFYRLYVRRKALVNCLKRLGTVESGLLKRGLASLVKPSALRPRAEAFRPRPSRLSLMSKAN